jgi:hypothetical protein
MYLSLKFGKYHAQVQSKFRYLSLTQIWNVSCSSIIQISILKYIPITQIWKVSCSSITQIWIVSCTSTCITENLETIMHQFQRNLESMILQVSPKFAKYHAQVCISKNLESMYIHKNVKWLQIK